MPETQVGANVIIRVSGCADGQVRFRLGFEWAGAHPVYSNQPSFAAVAGTNRFINTSAAPTSLILAAGVILTTLPVCSTRLPRVQAALASFIRVADRHFRALVARAAGLS